MNKILLPDYPGNNLLFHCVSHGNAVDALNLLESIYIIYRRQRSISKRKKCKWMHTITYGSYDSKHKPG